MPQSRSSNNNLDSESEILLELLNVVHDNSDLTQRSMANELGIALGMANSYLKRCVRKGFIKVRQIPSNRYSYYLTPTGFAEKSRLTAEYLSCSLTFFRRAKGQCFESLRYATARKWTRVALAGTGELAEICTLCALDNTVNLVGIFDPSAKTERFAGMPVFKNFKELCDLYTIDSVIVTVTHSPQKTFDQLIETFPSERILTLPVLGISREARMMVEQT
jgi:DNA-binding MarR family transcriptional regulator